MKKQIISFLIATTMLCAGLEEAIEYDRSPSRIKVSVNSVNRIVFPDNISFKIWSKEKNIDIVTHENELYLKYQPLETSVYSGNEVEDRNYIYNGVPVDIFVATENGKTYSLLFMPSEIESRNVILTDNTISQDLISNSLLKADSHSSVVSSIIKDVTRNQADYFYNTSFQDFNTSSDCFEIKQNKRLENGKHIVDIYSIKATNTCDIDEKTILKLINIDALGFGFDRRINTIVNGDTVNGIAVRKAPNVIW